MIDYAGTQKWYAEKCNKTVEEFDEYDNHLCKVAYDYACEMSELTRTTTNVVTTNSDGSHWFHNILNRQQRVIIRSNYKLNARTLKITDGMLDEVLLSELNKLPHKRLLENSYYDMSTVGTKKETDRLNDIEKKAINVMNFVATFDGVIDDEDDLRYILLKAIEKYISPKRRHLVSVTETAYPMRIKY